MIENWAVKSKKQNCIRDITHGSFPKLFLMYRSSHLTLLLHLHIKHHNLVKNYKYSSAKLGERNRVWHRVRGGFELSDFWLQCPKSHDPQPGHHFSHHLSSLLKCKLQCHGKQSVCGARVGAVSRPFLFSSKEQDRKEVELPVSFRGSAG